jgi:hypothetical protein
VRASVEETSKQDVEKTVAAKLPYHPPVMVDYGQVVALTHGNQ